MGCAHVSRGTLGIRVSPARRPQRERFLPNGRQRVEMLRDKRDPLRSPPPPAPASLVGTCHGHGRTSPSTRVEPADVCSCTRLLLRRCAGRVDARDLSCCRLERAVSAMEHVHGCHGSSVTLPHPRGSRVSARLWNDRRRRAGGHELGADCSSDGDRARAGVDTRPRSPLDLRTPARLPTSTELEQVSVREARYTIGRDERSE